MSEIKMSSLGFFHALVLSSLFSYFQRMYEYPLTSQEMPESTLQTKLPSTYYSKSKKFSYILFQTILTV